MAHKITDECIACGACAGSCPVNAISEGDGKYVVDAGACIDCGACEGECPTGATLLLISKQDGAPPDFFCDFFVVEPTARSGSSGI